MERDSLIYKVRRKCQELAFYLLPHDFLAKLYSRIILKETIDLDNPQTFNEKIQWLKLNDFPNNDLVINGADKYAVRNYIIEKGLEEKLVPLLGKWNNPEDIEWNQLPNQFVLKCNHGCAYNIICSDKSKLDESAVKQQLGKWLKEDFGVFNVELHYSKIKPHVITCEKYLGEDITDYKFFCFNGKPRYIYVSKDLVHDRQAQIGFFYLNGTKMPIKREDYTDLDTVVLPSFFDEMTKDAETLAQDFTFVRVDFFLDNNTYYFAELTFTPSAGMMPFNPRKFDRVWGELLEI